MLTTANTVVNTIDYRNTGVILRVAPRINANGNVRLDIEQEISNVSAATAASLTPTVSERKVKSSISVATGQTVLLAGLISEQQNGNRNGVPLLEQDLGAWRAPSPIGYNTGTRTELIISLSVPRSSATVRMRITSPKNCDPNYAGSSAPAWPEWDAGSGTARLGSPGSGSRMMEIVLIGAEGGD